MKPSTPTARPNKPKPPVVGTEQVQCVCGHFVPFELFADKQDRFRADRRKKLADRACSACRQKAAAERTAKDQAAAAERKQANAGKPTTTRASGRPRPPRLPDGATFAVSYDAEAQRWSGTLTIPGPGEEMQTFKGEASGVFKLLERLDGMYRQQAGPRPVPPA